MRQGFLLCALLYIQHLNQYLLLGSRLNQYSLINEVIGFPLVQTSLPGFKLLLRLMVQTRKTQESNVDLFFRVSETQFCT